MLPLRRGQRQFNWRRNEQIRAESLRVIGPEGKQIGILSRERALEKAKEVGFDLVEIAPRASPPVVKIIDFTKFLYEQEKKIREERKKLKRGKQLKEIWLTPFIAENDYRVRLERIKEFLDEGAKVRITIKPKRRITDTKPLYRVMGKALGDIAEIARVEQEPKMLGRQLVCIISPTKRGATHGQEKNEV